MKAIRRGQERKQTLATSAPNASHRDQELDPGAGLGDLEIAGRRGDEDAFEMGGHAGEREQAERRSRAVTRLHRRHELLADRDQEQGVEEREGEAARHRLAEAGDDRALEHQHQPEMAGEGDAARLAEQPAQRAGADEQQARRTRRRASSCAQLAAGAARPARR